MLFASPTQMWSRASLYHVPGVSPPAGLFNFLFTGYWSSFLLLRKYTWGRREGWDSFCEIFWHLTYHCYFPFGESHCGPQNGPDLCPKPLVNSVWKMSRKLRGSLATLGRGRHLAFLSLELLERGVSCFDQLPWEVARVFILGTGCVLLTLPTWFAGL